MISKEGEVTMFDEARFNELLKQFYELKAKNLYRRADWKTDGALVKTVRGLLDEVAEQLKYLICANNKQEKTIRTTCCGFMAEPLC